MSKYHTIYLKDYAVPSFLIETTDLVFDLSEEGTTVTAKTVFVRNPKQENKSTELLLNGEKLKLIEIQINDQKLAKEQYAVTDKNLTIFNPPDKFELTLITEIHPETNTELVGLYKSKTLFCTQCEAEGFRRITYFLDRPDVMASYTVKIIADKTRYPFLLSNGNPIAKGDVGADRHYVTWQDPFKKPSYLFALVAGDLDVLEDTFITQSQREIDLKVFVDKGNLTKAQHAMAALKMAMSWDEEKFGREYDLDIYMIVAVNDFNMGAMENKGLNIFNTKYVLANSDIATDDDYQAIIGVIGHEYFHNWTGNRITCRDWFQLSLKEGLTIFRDQEFTADMTSRTVKRIKDVRTLRTYQFTEDASPMAHPVRPDSYIEINNFYTHTIYEKGAEVIRMMKTLLGDEGFRRGMDLYFERNDGQAVTIEAFVQAMEDANQFDLTQFRLWYSQIGTPKVTVKTHYDSAKQSYELELTQTTGEKPLLIPIALSLLDEQGQVIALDGTMSRTILQLKEPQQKFSFSNIKTQPVPVLLHDFSAPITLEIAYSDTELTTIICHAENLFCRYEAMQMFFMKQFKALVKNYNSNEPLVLSKDFIYALAHTLSDSQLESAFVAEMLTLPTEKLLCSLQTQIDVVATHYVRRFIFKEIAQALHDQFLAIYQKYSVDSVYSINQTAVGHRQLKNIALQYLMINEQADIIESGVKQYYHSNNMTDRLAALQAVINFAKAQREECINNFYQHWQHEALVIDKWFTIQALANQADTFENVVKLTQHPAFTITNPNRVRSLIGAFTANNMFHFHRIDGKGYEFLADYIIQLDKINPQVAARLLEPLISWKKFDAQRQELMQKQLQRITLVEGLSNDVYEIVNRAVN